MTKGSAIISNDASTIALVIAYLCVCSFTISKLSKSRSGYHTYFSTIVSSWRKLCQTPKNAQCSICDIPYRQLLRFYQSLFLSLSFSLSLTLATTSIGDHLYSLHILYFNLCKVFPYPPKTFSRTLHFVSLSMWTNSKKYKLFISYWIVGMMIGLLQTLSLIFIALNIFPSQSSEIVE
jgi:hypothetical protein